MALLADNTANTFGESICVGIGEVFMRFIQDCGILAGVRINRRVGTYELSCRRLPLYKQTQADIE
jgi:hypothetical protein